jgi:hypothetical protein
MITILRSGSLVRITSPDFDRFVPIEDVQTFFRNGQRIIRVYEMGSLVRELVAPPGDGDVYDPDGVITGPDIRTFALTTDNPSGDAFGRLRVSEPQALHDGKNIFGDDQTYWSTATSGGATAAAVGTTGRVKLSAPVPVSGSSWAIRATRQCFPYQAGRSQRVLITGVFPDVESDSDGSWLTGIGDRFTDGIPNSGLGIGSDSGGRFIWFKYPTWRKIYSSLWSIDRMDGNGPSGIAVDWDKPQIIDIDFEWLGVGRIRFGLNIAGSTHYIHHEEVANNYPLTEVPYIPNPNLRVFYSVYNTELSLSSAAIDLYQVCSSVQSESGSSFLGATRMLRRTAAAAGVGTSFQSILAARIASDKVGTIVNYFGGGVFTTDNVSFEFMIVVNPTITAGAETWGSVPLSNLQQTIDINNVVTGNGIIIGGGFGSSTAQARTYAADQYESALKLGHQANNANTPDEIHILVRTLTGTAAFWAHIDLEEGY